LHDRRSPASVDSAIHASSSRKTSICRVDNRINLLEGDIALVQLDRPTVNCGMHGNVLVPICYN